MRHSALLDFALSYLDLGWAIFPLHSPYNGLCSCGRGDCHSPGKHPRTKQGVLDASTDKNRIREWWQEWPEANVGLATGAPSGVWVLDLDTPDADRGIIAATGEPLPNTVAVITGRGRHLYFKMPPLLNITNRAAIVPGVDVRGTGGYVVAPPSIHPNGTRYQWDAEAAEEATYASPELLDLVLKEPPKKIEVASPKVSLRGMESRHRSYLEGALKRAAESVQYAGEGQRNATLNREAYSLAGLGIPWSEIHAALTPAALRAGLSEREIAKTLSSGLKSGSQAPRALPEPTAPLSRALSVVPPPPSKETPSGDIPEELEKEFHLTDTGNAERFLDLHEGRVRYCADKGLWYLWDGVRWQTDRTNEVQRLGKAVCGKIREEAEAIEGEDEFSQKRRQAVKQWAQKSESAERRSAMVRLALGDSREIQVLPEQFDAEAMLLNCANGILDLRTSELRPHSSSALCTKVVPASFDPKAECPLWEKFIRQIMCDDNDLIRFVQTALGYTLTGSVKEQCLFFMHGDGSNGKSTFIEVIKELMSDYGQKAEFKTFIEQKNDGPRNDLAGLAGARFVAASESNQQHTLDETFVKEITGGDTVKCRFLHEEYFEYKPQFKIWLASNYKPIIKGTDDGIWRRIKLIPFRAKFEDKDKDLDLPQKLLAELPGILAWAVRGIERWREKGLGVPVEVTEATQDYRAEMDLLADFIAAKCKVSKKESVGGRALYKAYKAWCAAEDTKELSETSFSLKLSGKGFHKKRSSAGIMWVGISVEGVASQSEF